MNIHSLVLCAAFRIVFNFREILCVTIGFFFVFLYMVVDGN